jgi:hypothetical protein
MAQIEDDVHARSENAPDDSPQTRCGPVVEIARREAPKMRV